MLTHARRQIETGVGRSAVRRDLPVEAAGSGGGYSDFGMLGTRTTRMPAAVAACTPMGASSTTRHSSGGTPSRWAAAAKQSGAGFPLSTCAHLNFCLWHPEQTARGTPVCALLRWPSLCWPCCLVHNRIPLIPKPCAQECP